jgi:hypothetical protein
MMTRAALSNTEKQLFDCGPTFEKFQLAKAPPQRAYSIFDSS